MAKKIALDAGHGLKTAGKQTPDGIKEWTLNDKVRDKVVAMLADYDVEIIFPDGDEGNTDEGLTARRSMYVNANVDAAVSIHHNAYTGTWNNATGVETYVDKNHTAADMKLAQCIQTRLVANTGMKDRGVKKANWAVINQNSFPAVLTEGGFMDGRNDHAYITSDEGQTAYAKAVAEGLIEFLGLKKKTASKPAATPSTEPEETRDYLMNGDEGAEVKEMQQDLIKLGFSCGKHGADGDFGDDTEKAVKAFQHANGLVEDGLYGPKSKAKAKELLAKASTPATTGTFKVKFKEDMNVRTGAGTKYKAVNTCKKNYIYTIVDTTKVGTALWGKLKSGAGWVCIAAKYCDRV